MKCERIPFFPEHLSAFEPKPIFLEGAIESAVTVSRRPGAFTETIAFDGEPVAVIGLVVLWRGVGSVWSITSEKVRVMPKGFHEAVLAAINEYMEALGLWRVQMNVMAKHKENARWAEALGFRNEGRMVKFDPKQQDYFRYARVR